MSNLPLIIKLARDAERDLRKLALIDEDQERSERIYQLIRGFRRIFPDLHDDPYMVEIKTIFADYPKQGKHLRSDVYSYYVNHCDDPLPARSFWPLFRKVYNIYECSARVQKSTCKALFFRGAQANAPVKDELLVCADEQLIRETFSRFPRATRVNKTQIFDEYRHLGGLRSVKSFWSAAARCANFTDGRDSDDSTIIIQ